MHVVGMQKGNILSLPNMNLLTEVGSFAQVHTIVETDTGTTQLLLVGHRRLRRLKMVFSLLRLLMPTFKRTADLNFILLVAGNPLD